MHNFDNRDKNEYTFHSLSVGGAHHEWTITSVNISQFCFTCTQQWLNMYVYYTVLPVINDILVEHITAPQDAYMLLKLGKEAH